MVSMQDLFPDLNYDIKDELQIKRIIESWLPWEIGIKKTKDKYFYDMEIFNQYKGGEYTEEILGYIELEHSNAWKDFDLPAYWKEPPTFLYRKLFEYSNGKWLGPKEKTDNTIYLIFNHILSNCICRDMTYIINNGIASSRNNKQNLLKQYNDCYMKLEKDQYIWGLINCGFFIKNYFNDINEGNKK